MPEHIKRVRSHIIADLSENHVERAILHEGHTVEFRRKDYGIDAVVYTHKRNGAPEPGYISLQLKATDKINIRGGVAKKQISAKHLKSWSEEAYPVILIFYDAKSDAAYWLHLQPYLKSLKGKLKKSKLLSIPTTNVWDRAAVKNIRELKNKIHTDIIAGLKKAR